jgi:hypothetical protein
MRQGKKIRRVGFSGCSQTLSGRHLFLVPRESTAHNALYPAGVAKWQTRQTQKLKTRFAAHCMLLQLVA